MTREDFSGHRGMLSWRPELLISSFVLLGNTLATADEALNAQSAVIQALRVTQQTGRLCVIGVTSTANPASQEAWRHLLSLNSVQEMSRSGTFVELPLELDPNTAKLLKVQAANSILVYGGDGRRIRLVGHKSGLEDPYLLARWLETMGLVAGGGPRIDPSVSQASHFHQQPSPQQPVPQVPISPQPPTQFMMPVAQPTMAPVYTAPALAPTVVSPPSAPVVVQPSAPTVVVGPTPAPNIIFAQSAPAAPSVTMMAAPAPTPSVMMMAPQPVQAAPMAMAPVQALAPAPMMATQPQQSVVGTTVVGLLLSNPNLIDRILGAIGRLLARRGQPRMEMTQTPAMMAMPTAVPVSPQPMFPALQGVPAAPQQVYAVPEAHAYQPTPSPQHSHSGSWFRR